MENSIPNHTIFYIILLIYLSLTALGLCRCVDFSLVLVSGSYSLVIKLLSTMRETQVRSLGQEEPLEKEMAVHSSTIAWKIPWTEELGRLQSMGLQRVGHG